MHVFETALLPLLRNNSTDGFFAPCIRLRPLCFMQRPDSEEVHLSIVFARCSRSREVSSMTGAHLFREDRGFSQVCSVLRCQRYVLARYSSLN